MKKLYSFFVLLAAVTMFTACGDDDATYTPTPILEVSNADLIFEATGGNGTIQVNTTGTLTATTESSWVTLSVSGNTVNVTVAENPTLNGRSATIKLTANGITSQVSATQKGGTYGLIDGTTFSFDNRARNLNLALVHTSAVKVESLCNWLTASFNTSTDEFEIKVDENDSGWRRTGKIAFQTGDIRDTITISQFDFIACIQGEYRLWYTSSGNYVYQPVEIVCTSNTEGKIVFTSGTYATMGIEIPISIDAGTYSFSVLNLAPLDAKYTRSGVTYDLIMMVNYTNGTSIYRRNSATFAAIATLDEEEDGIYFDFDMSNEVSHSSYQFYALRIGYTTDGYAGYVGAFVTFPYCFLEKL